MDSICKKLWNDQDGFIISIELVLIATITVIGLITGMTAIRDAVVCEMSDVAGAMQDLNQSYTYTGVSGPDGSTAGSSYTDATDWCDEPEDPTGTADNCITFSANPTDEIE